MNIHFCGIAFILIMINIIFICLNPTKEVSIFKKTLSQDKLTQYNKIYYHRLMIYIIATISGIIIAYLYIYFKKNEPYKLCKFIVIAIIIQLCIYYIYPKKKKMVYYLQNTEQIKQWYHIQDKYNNSWKYSILISIVAYAILYKSFMQS